MTDEQLARSYCAARGWCYLSLETYDDMLAIAVEFDGERWEQRTLRLIAIADAALGDFTPPRTDKHPSE